MKPTSIAMYPMRKIIRSLGLVVVSIFALFVLINFGDSPLDPQVAQALTAPHESQPERNKAYHYLAGFYTPSNQDPAEVGFARVERQKNKELHPEAPTAVDNYNSTTLRLNGGAVSRFTKSIPLSNEWQKLKPEFDLDLEKNKLLLDRFDRLVELGPYSRDIKANFQIHTETTAFAASKWYLAQSLNQLYLGNYDEAARRTGKIEAFLAGSLSGDQSMIEALLLLSSLKQNHEFAKFALGYNAKAKAAFQPILPKFQLKFDINRLSERIIQAETQAFDLVLQGPLHISNFSIAENDDHNRSQDMILDPILNLLLKRQESVNLFFQNLTKARQFAFASSALASGQNNRDSNDEKARDNSWSLSDFRNPVGKFFANQIFAIRSSQFEKFQKIALELNKGVH